MDDNMEMQEWLEANKEIYSDFKSKIQSVLNNWLCDNGTELNDDETDTFQNLLVEAMDEEGGTAENLIDGFSKAIKEGNGNLVGKRAADYSSQIWNERSGRRGENTKRGG